MHFCRWFLRHALLWKLPENPEKYYGKKKRHQAKKSENATHKDVKNQSGKIRLIREIKTRWCIKPGQTNEAYYFTSSGFPVSSFVNFHYNNNIPSGF